MSIKMMTQVWAADDTITEQGELLVMLVLADFSNDDGVCWPTMRQIALKARMDRRSARRIISRLEERGMVVRQRSEDGRHNHYLVVVHPDSETSEGRTESPRGVGPRVRGGRTQESGGVGLSIHSPPHPPYKAKPSMNRQTPRESDLFDETEDGGVDSQHRRSWKELFEEWWAIYPRKASRKKAEEKFRAALKQASFETLMQATRNYAAAMSAKGTEQQFIAHGSTWLNQERWNDWLSPEEEPSEAMRMLKNMGYA